MGAHHLQICKLLAAKLREPSISGLEPSGDPSRLLRYNRSRYIHCCFHTLRIFEHIKKQHYALFKSLKAMTPEVFPLTDAVAADIYYEMC